MHNLTTFWRFHRIRLNELGSSLIMLGFVSLRICLNKKTISTKCFRFHTEQSSRNLVSPRLFVSQWEAYCVAFSYSFFNIFDNADSIALLNMVIFLYDLHVKQLWNPNGKAHSGALMAVKSVVPIPWFIRLIKGILLNTHYYCWTIAWSLFILTF